MSARADTGERARVRGRGARAGLFLFLTLWLGYGLTVNSSNLYEFNLQQIGVEAIAERGNFYLEGSRVPELVPRGDVFLHGGRKYAAKQPGQFMAGALAYTLLRPFGVSYVADYPLASALVTFLTASLVTALAGLAVFRLARSLDPEPERLSRPLAVALAYGFATTAFPYAGIAHHDALASGYLLLAFYLVFRVAGARGREGRGEKLRAAGAGLLLGLTLTTSMLPALMTAVVIVYFVTLRRWRLLPLFAAGALAGLAPLLVYNAASFGNPLLMPNVAGNYSDTFFRLDAENFLDKLRFYTRTVALYVPVFAVGAAGLLFYPRARRREQLAMLALVAVLLVYVLNIDTRGGHQYGPRYMLPLMPYAALGLLGYAFAAGGLRRRLALLLVAVAALFSAGVNLLGALHGSMYSDTAPYAAPVYLSAIARGETRDFPLAPWLAAPFVVSLAMLVYCAWAGRGESASSSR
ncbi:MAG TPA: hypothetical protein VER32_13810 [Pyrinomonadaceae bacterium]|nr:hypothetical protein [Pyrinomonadaceae bacterium]